MSILVVIYFFNPFPYHQFMMIKEKAPYQLGCLSSRWSSENLCRVGFARDRRPGCAASRESPHPGDNDDDDDDDDD